MTEVTEEMILDYLMKKGGVVRNVDLVRHFRKHLQNESSSEKDRARVIFKERVNTVAYIKAEKQDKYLHIRPEYMPPGGLTRPPTGRMSSGSNRNSVASLGSLEDAIPGRNSNYESSTSPYGQRHDSSSDYLFGHRSPPSEPDHKHESNQPPAIATTSSKAMPPPAAIISPPPSATTPPLLSKGTNDDFGSTLMAELDTFGSLLDSMGYKGPPSSNVSKTAPSSASVNASSSVSGTSAPPTNPTTRTAPPAKITTRSSSSYLASYEANSRVNAANSTTTSSYNSHSPSSDTYSSSTSHSPSTSTTSHAPSTSTTSHAPSTSTTNHAPSTSTTSHTPSTSTTSHTPVDASVSATPSSDQPSKIIAGSGMGMTVGLATLTRFSPSKSHVNTSPSHSKPAKRRGQSNNADMDLMSVLSSLPSANPSSFGKKPPSGAGKPPSGAGKPPSGIGKTTSNAGKPPSGPSQPAPGLSSGPGYQNSTRFDQPQAGYQNSTRFAQPSAQPGYQNSTKFVQPPLPNQQQSSYQNSTRFAQPQLPHQQQPSFQNSTKFAQPPLPNQQQQQQASYQNTTRFVQPPLPNQQPSYHNSTKFSQPPLPNLQQSYQPLQPQPGYQTGQQPVSLTTPSDSDSPFNPLAVLSRNVPQATNPAPLPPVDPSFSSRDNMPRLSALLTNDSPVPLQVPPPGAGEDTRRSPDAQANMGSSGGPPLAPVRTSSIGQGTSGRGKSGYVQDDRGSGTVQTSSPPSSSPSHSLPRRTAPPPPQAASNRNSKDSPGRVSNSSPGSAPNGQRASVTSSGPAPRNPISSSGLSRPTSHSISGPSGGQSSTSPSPLTVSNSASSGMGSMDLGDIASSMFSSIGGSLSTHSNTLGRTPKSSSSGQATSLQHAESASLPSMAMAGVASGPAPTPSSMHNLGPVVSVPAGGVARSHLDGSSRRKDSFDSTPSIRVDSATDDGGGSGTSSPSTGRSLSPAGSNGAGIVPQDSRGRTLSFQGVQIRNKPSRTGPGSAVRRSRNLDNKDCIARLSVSMTPPSSRKATQPAPPDVAPKPLRHPSPSPARSGEDIRYMDNEDMDDYDHEQEYDYIDPLEKEWILAAVQSELDTQQRLLATDSTLLNRKDFLHGYTGLHWAAKHGRMDILSMLLDKGAMVDIKSNGLTPLHVAAQAGHERVIFKLVTEHNANINLREHGGRRPIDMLNNRVSVGTKKLLSNLNNHGFPIRIEMTHRMCTFTQARNVNANQERMFGAVAEVIIQAPIEREKSIKKKPSPRSSIRKSFSFKTKQRVRDQISPPKVIGVKDKR